MKTKLLQTIDCVIFTIKDNEDAELYDIAVPLPDNIVPLYHKEKHNVICGFMMKYEMDSSKLFMTTINAIIELSCKIVVIKKGLMLQTLSSPSSN